MELLKFIRLLDLNENDFSVSDHFKVLFPCQCTSAKWNPLIKP